MANRKRTTKRRARLYGVSSDDPLLNQERRPKTVFSGAKEPRRHNGGEIKESRGQWYTGCTRISPGSFSAACARYGGEGAEALAARTADVSAKSAGFDIASHSELAQEWSPSMLAEPIGYIAGPRIPYTTRNWPIEATYPAGFKPNKLYNMLVAEEHTRRRKAKQRVNFISHHQPASRSSQNVDGRAAEHHRKLISQNAILKRLPARGSLPIDHGTLFMRPQSSLTLRSRGDSQKCSYSGPTIMIKHNETREEVVQRMHLERARENERQHYVRWVLLRAFLKACESHLMPSRSKHIMPVEVFPTAEQKQNATRAILIDDIYELFLGDDINTTILKRKTKRTIFAICATTGGSKSMQDGQRRVIGKARPGDRHQHKGNSFDNANANHPNSPKSELTSPSAPRVLHRDRFMLVIQKQGLNFPTSMATQFWNMIGRGNVLDVTRLLCSLRILINANIDPGGYTPESIETKLDGLFKIYEKHCGKVEKLEQVFTVASKTWDERKTIHDLLEKRFFFAITAIMHERDQLSGKVLTSDSLSGVVLTQNDFNEGLRRCPDLVAEFVSQINHPIIRA